MTEKPHDPRHARAIVARVAAKTSVLASIAAVIVLVFLLLRNEERWWSFPLGIIIGGALSILNFRWLAFIVERIYTKKDRPSALPRILDWPLNILKLSAIFIILYVVIKYKLIHVIGLVSGLTISFIAILWEGFSAMSRMEKGSDTGGRMR